MNVVRIRHAAVAVAVAVLAFFLPAAPALATLNAQELKCSASLAKNLAKLQKTILKITAECHLGDISGQLDDPNACDPLPAELAAKVDSARGKFVAAVAKSCKSVCSISNDIDCISDLTCPARHSDTPANNSIAERCTGKGGSAPFRLAKLDWPGPYCESVLGQPMTKPTDFGECVLGLADEVIDPFDRAIFSDLDETSGLGESALECAASISKAVQHAAGRAYVATASCRDSRRSAYDSRNPTRPWACAAEDEDTIATIQRELARISKAVARSCTNDDILALGNICAEGGAAATSVEEATACLSDLVREVATQERGGPRHVYSKLGMLNLTHPGSAAAYCGDGVVTSTREEHTGVGEECDGDADAACGSGSCLPPGDLFECTCDNTPRERFIVKGDADHTDSDTGWSGASHDATHNDGFGYVTELSNCNCSEFTQATCTGSSSDPVCDVRGNMAPRCSDDLDGTQSCDERGNGNGTGEDRDCFACDANSINAGTWCANLSNADETVCQSQCFTNATGLAVVPQKPCAKQEDCGEGETCKGRCDNTLTCNTMTEGSPLPLVSAANATCVELQYKSDITGTKNIVTGESAIQYSTRLLIQLGSLAQPCPLCGGICVGGTNGGKSCYGRCDAGGEPCLMDADCAAADTCLETADECPGGSCSLDLRCSIGSVSPNSGKLCRPDSVTPMGVVSHDCPPYPANVISGSGVLQTFEPMTTGQVQFPEGSACTKDLWHNYDCPCPADGGGNIGTPTQPNSCAGACDGGINEGKGCATGGGGAGGYTRCAGGTDANFPCDSDEDCEGGTCSFNPKECTAGTPALIGLPCTIDSNCGAGGVCSDSCPGARCVPLCYPEGKCTGGARDGDACSTLDHCRQCTAGNPLLIGTGCETNARCDSSTSSGDGRCEAIAGVTCQLVDGEDGICAAGPTKYRCTGAGFTSTPCSLDYGTCTAGTCQTGSPSLRGAPCTAGRDCLEHANVPVSSGCETGTDSIPGTSDDIPGAGECETRPEDCFVNNGISEGGDTGNGEGSPSDVNLNAAFCTPPNSNPAINDVSGFGGPSRIRRTGSAFVNVPSIP